MYHFVSKFQRDKFLPVILWAKTTFFFSAFTLFAVEKAPIIIFETLCWIFSIFSFAVEESWFHIGAEYSTIGVISDVKIF